MANRNGRPFLAAAETQQSIERSSGQGDAENVEISQKYTIDFILLQSHIYGSLISRSKYSAPAEFVFLARRHFCARAAASHP